MSPPPLPEECFEFLERYRQALAAGEPVPDPPAALTAKLNQVQNDLLRRLLAFERENHLNDRSTVDHRPAGSAGEPPPGPPPLAGYRIQRKLGEGGMGEVFLVEDRRLRRPLALKRILAKWETDPASRGPVRARFLEEMHLLGQLTHPGIPPVHTASGPDEERLWYTMRLVDGQTLKEHLKGWPNRPHDPEWYLTRLVAVCQAVGYAHGRGLVHRDLKPANVMLGRDGEVLVMDWGLARRVGAPADDAPGFDSPRGDDGRALTGGFVGTPAYAAPEQANNHPLTPAADVFGLGSILCEVLTGRPAYDLPSAARLIEAAARGEVADALTRLADCDADPAYVRLAVECLSVDPSLRPADARAVAERLEAVARAAAEAAREARDRQERAEAARRRLRRALGGTAAAAAVFAALSWAAWTQRDRARAATGAAEAEAERAGRATAEANRRLNEVSRLLDLRRIADADRAATDGEVVNASVTLSEVGEANRGFAWRLLGRQLAGVAWTRPGPAGPALAVGGSADGRRAVAVGGDGTVVVWALRTGEEQSRSRAPAPSAAAVFGDGRRVLLAGPDGVLRVWDADRGQVTATIGPVGGPVDELALAGDGSRVAALVQGAVRVWEVSTGNPVAVIAGKEEALDAFHAVALSGDGRVVATRSINNLTAWEVATGRPITTLPGAGAGVSGVFGLALTRDGRRAVTAEWFGGAAAVWGLDRGQREARITGRYDTGVQHVAVSPDGTRVASWHTTHGLHVADARTGRLVRSLVTDGRPSAALAFSPDSALLLAVDSRGRLAVIDVREELALDGFEVAAHGAQPGAVGPLLALSPDGRGAAAIGEDRAGRVWDTHSRRLVAAVRPVAGDVADVALSDGGARLVLAGRDGTVSVRETRSGATVLQFSTAGGRCVLSRDGTRLAASSDEGVTVWDTGRGLAVATIAAPRRPEGRRVVISPDGTTLALLGAPTEVFDARTGGRLATLNVDGLRPTLSRGGKYLFVDGGGVFDVATARAVANLPSHTGSNWGGVGSGKAVAFSDTEDVLAALYPDGSLRLFDLPSGHEVVRRTVSATPVRAAGAALSVTGGAVTVVLPDGRVQRFEAVTAAPAGSVGSTRPDARWHANRRDELLGRGEWPAAALHAAYEQRALAAAAGRPDRAALHLLGALALDAVSRAGGEGPRH